MEYLKITRATDVILEKRGVEFQGVLHLTTHHLIYTFSNREIWICYPILQQVVHLTESKTLKLNCKDFQFLAFTFKDTRQCQDVFDSIQNLTVLSSVQQLYAFNYQPNQIEATYNSWTLYNPIKELRRQGLRFQDAQDQDGPATNWRITTLNDKYQLCPTYPSTLVIPATISDTVVTHAAKFRSKQRIPVLSYFYKQHGTSITRCAQPLTGLKQSRSIQDEKLILEIFRASEAEQSSNLIVDARPQTNAMAQTALGAGSEIMDNYPAATKIFLGIDNIHVMRESLSKVALLVSDFTTPVDTLALANTKWLKFISIILTSVEKLTKYMVFNKSNLLVHCSDGWDRTSQITSLVQLCIDPHFRTLQGFITLIEKEWLAFGHRFNERSGHTSNSSNFQSEEGEEAEGAKRALRSVTSQFRKLRTMDLTSPIFQQFLDTVYQIQRQFPTKFEFNERFLRRLVYHLYSCQYGTFLADTERERLEQVAGRTRSVWDYFLSRREEFTNKEYVGPKEGDDTYIIPNYKVLKWWWQLYGRSDEEMNGNKEGSVGIDGSELNNRRMETQTEEKHTQLAAAPPVPIKSPMPERLTAPGNDRMKGLTPPPPSKFNTATTYENEETTTTTEAATASSKSFESMDVMG